MNIELLSGILKHLIMENDTVALPGLGVFVAESVPASFSDKGNVINPPYRRLYFRERKQEDNLVRDFYALHNNVDSALASRMIDEVVSEIRKSIESKRLVEFPGMGKLRATKEKTLFFIADDDLDIYRDGFGLQSIYIRTIGVTGDAGDIAGGEEPTADVPAANEEPVPVVAAAVTQDVETTLPQEKVTSQTQDTQRRVKFAVLVTVCAVLALALMFILLCHLFPESEFIDKLFYDGQELDLVRWIRDNS